MRWLLVVALVSGLWAEDARASADRNYATAMTAYQQAEVDDSQGDAASARRHLAEAKAARDGALAVYRALSGQPDPDVVVKRGVELEHLGRTCCGRESLWERYGVARGVLERR